MTAKHSKALNSQFERDENIYINPKSKIIMLSWVEKNLKIVDEDREKKKNRSCNNTNCDNINYDNNTKAKIVFDEKIPKNIIFSKGGIIINRFLKCKGKDAYYER